MGSIEGAWAILDSRGTGYRIRVNASSVSVPRYGDETVGVAQLEGLHFEIQSRVPVHEGKK
jgi:hypothetical protein